MPVTGEIRTGRPALGTARTLRSMTGSRVGGEAVLEDTTSAEGLSALAKGTDPGGAASPTRVASAELPRSRLAPLRTGAAWRAQVPARAGGRWHRNPYLPSPPSR